MTQKIIRLRAVLERLSVGKTTLYSLIAEGRFPKPILISVHRVGWLESDVDAYIAECVRAARELAP